MKSIFFILSLFFFSNAVFAQNIYNSTGRKVAQKKEKTRGFDVDKLVVGGDFRLSAGQGVNVGVAPMLGYKLAKNFILGVRVGYNFTNFRQRFTTPLPSGSSVYNFSSHNYSGSMWLRYLIWESFYLHVEAEYNSFKVWDGTWDYNTNKMSNDRLLSPSVLAGIGFRQPINDRVSLNTTILFDVLNDPQGYYQFTGSIDYRIGILVGF
ncbi:MAG: hypothetical protein IT256_03890 [Chitinophagaceae bacterium]|nr:hypothetical protein [Chitinophagaceae bacterium]